MTPGPGSSAAGIGMDFSLFRNREYLRAGDFAKIVPQMDKLAALRQCPFAAQRKISGSKIFRGSCKCEKLHTDSRSRTARPQRHSLNVFGRWIKR